MIPWDSIVKNTRLGAENTDLTKLKFRLLLDLSYSKQIWYLHCYLARDRVQIFELTLLH